MSKTETSAAGIKAAYICPGIACFAAEYSLCAGSLGGGHEPALPGEPPIEEESIPGSDPYEV